MTSTNAPYRTVRSGGGRAIHLTADAPRDLNAVTLCGRVVGGSIVTPTLLTTCGHCARRAGVAKGETIHATPTATDERPGTDAPADERPAVSAREAVHAAPATPAATEAPPAGRRAARVGALLRKSRVVKDGTRALSIAVQDERFREWADREGLAVDERHVYRENVSGYVTDYYAADSRKLAKRDGFRAACDAMERGDIDVLAVVSLDRLSRSGAGHVMGLIDRGYRLYFIAENLDSADRSARMLIALFAEMARDHSAAKSETLRAVKRTGREAGYWSGPAPFGMLAEGPRSAKRLVRNPDTWPVVERIYRDAVDGASVREITRRLNSEGVPASRTKLWSTSPVYRILTHPAYEGLQVTTMPNGLPGVFRDAEGRTVNVLAEGTEPLAPTLVSAARAALQGRDFVDRSARPKAGMPSALLTGTARCVGCKGRMVKSGLSYACLTKHEGRHCPAPASVRVALADEYMTNRFLSYVPALDPADERDQVTLTTIAARWTELRRPDESADARAARDAEATAQAALERHMSDESAYPGAARTVWERRRDDLVAALVAASERARELGPAVTMDVGWMLDGHMLAEAWDAASIAERRTYLALAADTVWINQGAMRQRFDGARRINVDWASPESAE